MRPSPRTRQSGLAVVAVVVGFGAGCDDGYTPLLSDLRFDGPAPDSATVLLLSVDFRDGDGNLGTGFLETFIDGDPTSAGPLDLLPIFLRSDVPVDATDGTLEFVLELSIGSSSAPPPSGTEFSLGVRATDAADNTSSTASLGLRLTY
jgi:hypothetical protein